jgi:integrase
VARHPGLMRRGARYHIRVRVPRDLVAAIGRTEIWKSLGTADHREAVRKYFPARAELQKTFDEARRRRDANGKLSGGEALHIVRTWFREVDRKAADADFGLFEDDAHATLAETEQDILDLVEGAGGESIQAALHRVLINAGWPARPHVIGTIQTRRTKVAAVDGHVPAELHDLVRRGLVELARRRHERLRGSPNGVSFDPLFSNGAVVQPVANGHDSAGIIVGELIERFRAEKEPAQSPKLRSDYAMLYEIIGDLWGNGMPARAITRADCRRVKDLFEALPSNAKKRLRGKTLVQAAEHARAHNIAPMNPKTANQHLARLASMLKWALQEEHMDRNPAASLKVAALETDPRHARRPLTIDQLRRVFDAPLYRGCKDDQNGYMVPGPNVIRRGRFWVPLICLFGGLRMGEACQLGVDDVEIAYSVPVLRVRPDPEAGTRLKTKYSTRAVPIHAQLIKIGLLGHVEKMRRAGEVRLFPELSRDRRGSYAGHFQRWANRWLERAGAKGERQSFHSTRHTFVDALRRAGAVGEEIDDLLGWSRSDMRARYGEGPWIARLAAVMQRVEYPALDLSHLHVR